MSDSWRKDSLSMVGGDRGPIHRWRERLETGGRAEKHGGTMEMRQISWETRFLCLFSYSRMREGKGAGEANRLWARGEQ